MSRPDTVVFDVGGVLIEWDPRRLYRTLLPDEAAIDEFLATVCTPEWNREQDRGRATSEAVAALSAEFPEHADLVAAYYDRWEDMLGGPIAGTVDVLARLQASGVRTLALTNFSAEKWPIAQQRYEFLRSFSGVVVSGEEGVIKPDPEIFRILCTRHGVAPERAVYVDDIMDNVVAAESYGFDAVLFESPDKLVAELASRDLL